MAFIHRAILLLLCSFVHVEGADVKGIFDDWQNQFCNSDLGPFLPSYMCPSTTATTTTTLMTTTIFSTTQTSATTISEFTIGVTPTTTTTPADSNETPATTSSTPLERAHWCKFQNGSTIALGYSFMYSACAVCQCLPSRVIRCTNLQCLSTFCIDGSQPAIGEGQCCPQCAYENNSNTCTYNSIRVPHGTVVKRASTGETCWCQWGSLECRKLPGTSTVSAIWGDGMAIYSVVIIIIIILIVGTLSCVACSVFFYYYYRKRNQTMNEEFAQYWNHAGWQPMDADGAAVAEEKNVEAEQVVSAEEYPTGFNRESIPPPYVTFNGVYPNEKSQ